MLIRRQALASHECSLRARYTKGDTKCLALDFICLPFLLYWIQLLDLINCNRSALNARTPIHIHSQTSLYVPLYFLTMPAIHQSLYHFEAYNLMTNLHKIIEHCHISAL